MLKILRPPAQASVCGVSRTPPAPERSGSETVLHRGIHRRYLPATTAPTGAWLDRPRGCDRPGLRRVSARVEIIGSRRVLPLPPARPPTASRVTAPPLSPGSSPIERRCLRGGGAGAGASRSRSIPTVRTCKRRMKRCPELTRRPDAG